MTAPTLSLIHIFIQTIRQGINPKLAVGGILLTMYQGRTNLCRGIQDEIQADYGNAFTVFSSPIDFLSLIHI